MWVNRKWSELKKGDKVKSGPNEKPVVIASMEECLFWGDDYHRHFRFPHGSCYGTEIERQRWEPPYRVSVIIEEPDGERFAEVQGQQLAFFDNLGEAQKYFEKLIDDYHDIED